MLNSNDNSSDKRNADYMLVDGPAEIRRLSTMYYLLKYFFDNQNFLPEPINIEEIGNVLDVGAGTGIWTLDLADQSAAAARLPPHDCEHPLRLSMCDISTAKFPPAEVLAPVGIKAFQHDVLTPFPADMHGTFDLVNMNYLVIALTEDKWGIALKNVHDVLKPGGYLILRESDPVFYSASSPPPPDDGTPHDLPSQINGTTVVHKMNSMLANFAIKNGFVVGLSYRFPEFLEHAGLRIARRKRVLMPTGDLCDSYTTARGASMASLKATSIDNIDMALDGLSKALLDKGMLEAPVGTKIESEQKRLEMMKEVHERVAEGLLVVQMEVVAQRPCP
ncbi:unnamed protein product [Peniophora sp. CBMAI 1063]|nr:unnamed protein product [Peniophora sp. CBMAI 1063]